MSDSADEPLYRQEYPFPSHFLTVDEQQYHYVDEGEGETLLMVHGNPTWSFAFRRLIQALSSQYRVLAVDHIGCGLSSKPQDYPYTLAQHIANLQQFIEQLELQNITLFAHDWGGAIGMGTAAKLPDRFRQFVLFNTGAFRSAAIPKRIAACRIPLLGTFGIRGLNLFSRAALKMAVADTDHLTQAARQGYLAPYNSWRNRVAVNRFVKDIPLKAAHPSYAALKEVEEGLTLFTESPMLLIWGEQDWCFTTEFLKEFQTRFPQAETLQLPEAGHYVFEEEPETILERVQKFLSASQETDKEQPGS